MVRGKLSAADGAQRENQKEIMQSGITEFNIGGLFGGLLVLAYVVCIIAIIIYVLRLLGRFVRAHERVASALEIVARKLKDDGKP